MSKLTIIYGTGTGNTGRMAKAIEEGAKGAGVEVTINKIDKDTLVDIENADAIAIGSATYKGAAMPTVINYVKAMADQPIKGKVGVAFGSYGWSGEAANVISKMLEGYEMDVIKPNLRIKRQPSDDGIEECKKLGNQIADMINK
ncbi:MAG: FprA family A-type flavoprotein [ANME-2 cluster archaeon]|nr:FprA family A-type flavoprotein [ANME-2 cluster archaeon]MBC2707528.1 FprA family A-type flavoprotein [ANME-2 cluster archaeon]MBC2748459.1 FprA family A-type flavoprotein [ANME-2 cluster archaeon]MBC2763277.1 FprA family A-type flavoprotein [ANME-2 cluster archaeon]